MKTSLDFKCMSIPIGKNCFKLDQQVFKCGQKNLFIFHGGIRLELFALGTYLSKDRSCFCRSFSETFNKISIFYITTAVFLHPFCPPGESYYFLTSYLKVCSVTQLLTRLNAKLYTKRSYF